MNFKDKAISLLNQKELTAEQQKRLEEIFPELKDSEDEWIKRTLLKHLQEWQTTWHYIDKIPVERIIDWVKTREEPKIPEMKWDSNILTGIKSLTKDTKTFDLEKACEWLKDHTKVHSMMLSDRTTIDLPVLNAYPDEFIQNFRKEMEGDKIKWRTKL